MTESTFIEVVSELLNEVEMKLKEPNFYIVNSKKYLTDEQRNSVAEKIAQMSTNHNNQIKELTAHLRLADEANTLTPKDFYDILNQIDIASESQQPTDTWVEIKSEDDLPNDDKNVLVIIEGQMQIMCLCSIIDNDVYSKVWCMVYDGLDGDGIYDDNYYPTHWMPLPTHPQTTTK